jgi:hypothetical protein
VQLAFGDFGNVYFIEAATCIGGEVNPVSGCQDSDDMGKRVLGPAQKLIHKILCKAIMTRSLVLEHGIAYNTMNKGL